MISQACSPEQDEYKEEREAREGRRRHTALSPSSHSLGFSDSVSVPYPGQSKALSSSPSKQTQRVTTLPGSLNKSGKPHPYPDWSRVPVGHLGTHSPQPRPSHPSPCSRRDRLRSTPGVKKRDQD